MSNQTQRVRQAFMDAAESPGPDREAALDQACGGDAALRAEVEALLRADQQAGGFMISPTGAAAARTVESPIREGPGTRIGSYKILQLIGEGGFGSVFMAEQERPVQRRVALKIIKLGMDTRGVIARFEAERQALAMMDHPHIARVLDAGATETGRPYFVMELCKGDAIVEYCDKNNLSIKDRLELFAQVCQAVQHAHTKGIIHRDIKPSNVLVSTQDGRPHAKVIDFGIAKATASKLTEKTLFTEHRQLIGTPEYMSPEQAEGSLDIDTRTDVYSLGVLLYELLTGTTPFDAKALRSAACAEIQRIIREVEPPKPSTRLSKNTGTLASVAAHRHTEPRKLGTIIRGDLDWIVMKALEKDRSRRYETANGLAMDIRRYLSGEAVLAAPPSTAYRMRKFVRRHRVQVAAAGLVTVALLLGLTGTAWQAKLAADGAAAARKAEGEANAARDAEKARADELKQVSDFQQQMFAQVDPATAGARLTEDVNRRFAAALARANVSETGRAAQVEGFRAEWARVNATDAAMALIDQTFLKPAIKAINERFKDQPVVDAQLRQVLADRYRDLGLYDASQPLQASALSTRRRVLGEDHPDTLTSINNMGSLLWLEGRFAEAEPYCREAMEKRRRVLGEEHPDTLASIATMGHLLRLQGRLAEAEPYSLEALEKRRRVLGEEHQDTLKSIGQIGLLLQDQGKLTDAETYYREALEKVRRVLGEEHPGTLRSMGNMGVLLQSQGKLAEAEPYCREALEKTRRVLGEEHPDTLRFMGNMGGLLRDQGRFAEAEPCREAMEKHRRVLGEEHPSTLIYIISMGALLRDQGRHQDAIDLLAPVEPAVRKAFTGANARRLAGLLATLGRARVGFGYDAERFKLAEANLLEAHPIFITTRGEKHKGTLDCVQGLVDLYGAWDKAEPGKGCDAKAAEWRAMLGDAPTATQEK